MARSGYMEAKVNRWSEVKELVIEDCDPATFNLIVDYMYGIALPESMLSSSNDEEGIRQDLGKMYQENGRQEPGTQLSSWDGRQNNSDADQTFFFSSKSF